MKMAVELVSQFLLFFMGGVHGATSDQSFTAYPKANKMPVIPPVSRILFDL